MYAPQRAALSRRTDTGMYAPARGTPGRLSGDAAHSHTPLRPKRSVGLDLSLDESPLIAPASRGAHVPQQDISDDDDEDFVPRDGDEDGDGTESDMVMDDEAFSASNEPETTPPRPRPQSKPAAHTARARTTPRNVPHARSPTPEDYDLIDFDKITDPFTDTRRAFMRGKAPAPPPERALSPRRSPPKSPVRAAPSTSKSPVRAPKSPFKSPTHTVVSPEQSSARAAVSSPARAPRSSTSLRRSPLPPSTRRASHETPLDEALMDEALAFQSRPRIARAVDVAVMRAPLASIPRAESHSPLGDNSTSLARAVAHHDDAPKVSTREKTAAAEAQVQHSDDGFPSTAQVQRTSRPSVPLRATPGPPSRRETMSNAWPVHWQRASARRSMQPRKSHAKQSLAAESRTAAVSEPPGAEAAAATSREEQFQPTSAPVGDNTARQTLVANQRTRLSTSAGKDAAEQPYVMPAVPPSRSNRVITAELVKLKRRCAQLEEELESLRERADVSAWSVEQSELEEQIAELQRGRERDRRAMRHRVRVLETHMLETKLEYDQRHLRYIASSADKMLDMNALPVQLIVHENELLRLRGLLAQQQRLLAQTREEAAFLVGLYKWRSQQSAKTQGDGARVAELERRLAEERAARLGAEQALDAMRRGNGDMLQRHAETSHSQSARETTAVQKPFSLNVLEPVEEPVLDPALAAPHVMDLASSPSLQAAAGASASPPAALSLTPPPATDLRLGATPAPRRADDMLGAEGTPMLGAPSSPAARKKKRRLFAMKPSVDQLREALEGESSLPDLSA